MFEYVPCSLLPSGAENKQKQRTFWTSYGRESVFPEAGSLRHSVCVIITFPCISVAVSSKVGCICYTWSWANCSVWFKRARDSLVSNGGKWSQPGLFLLRITNGYTCSLKTLLLVTAYVDFSTILWVIIIRQSAFFYVTPVSAFSSASVAFYNWWRLEWSISTHGCTSIHIIYKHTHERTLIN